MTIEHQQKVAQQILDQLTPIDPYAILAGGAPRDWWFGKEANDLDIYFFTHATTISATEKSLKSVGIKATLLMKRMKHGEHELYSSMPSLKRIWEFEKECVKVQLIQLSDPNSVWRVTNHMDNSICQIAWKDGKYFPHYNFSLTILTNTMFPNEGYGWDTKHNQKMIERFPMVMKASSAGQVEENYIRKQIREMK